MDCSNYRYRTIIPMQKQERILEREKAYYLKRDSIPVLRIEKFMKEDAGVQVKWICLRYHGDNSRGREDQSIASDSTAYSARYLAKCCLAIAVAPHR